MKSLIAASWLSIFTLTVGPAAAETVDISTLRCSDIANMKPDEAGMILIWIDGYLGGQADDTRLDLDRFSSNADAAAKACEDNPDIGILTALKAAEAGN